MLNLNQLRAFYHAAKCLNFSAAAKNLFICQTAVTKHVLDRLVGKSSTASKKVRVCYVNCRKAGTEYRTLSSMCSVVGVKVPFTGLATAEVLSRFRRGLENTRSTFIAALDEIDVLVRGYGDGIMYKLTRINEELRSSRLTVIGISNDLYFKDLLDPRVRSSLSEEEMVFKPYTAEQIKDILSQRIRLAFRLGGLPDKALNLVTALAAAEHGDARRALDLLRVSGEIAERGNASAVREEHIREAAPFSEVHFTKVAVIPQQIGSLNLPTRPTKKTDSRARNFDGDSVEVDAIDPDNLRRMCRDVIEQHIDQPAYEKMRQVEQFERESLEKFVKTFGTE